jgi:hypothetical protein
MGNEGARTAEGFLESLEFELEFGGLAGGLAGRHRFASTDPLFRVYELLVDRVESLHYLCGAKLNVRASQHFLPLWCPGDLNLPLWVCLYQPVLDLCSYTGLHNDTASVFSKTNTELRQLMPCAVSHWFRTWQQQLGDVPTAVAPHQQAVSRCVQVVIDYVKLEDVNARLMLACQEQMDHLSNSVGVYLRWMEFGIDDLNVLAPESICALVTVWPDSFREIPEQFRHRIDVCA